MTYGDSISARLAVPSPLTIGLTVTYGTKGDTGTVDVQVGAVDSIAFAGLTLRLALTESGIEEMGTKDQVLRDYLPDELGIPFIVTQEDTFGHSEVFVIDPTWVAEQCRIVAFVQDDTTREVVQAVQSPVVTPGPQVVQHLRVTLSGDDLLLRWSPVTTGTNGGPLAVDFYQVYRHTAPSFGPGSLPLSTAVDTFYLDTSGVVGNLGVHYFYSVTAVAGGKESDFSGVVGEFDRFLSPGK